MSEQYDFDSLTDADLAAIENIIDGAEHRQHGEALLAMFENATERRQEQDREFLEVLRDAHQAEVEKAEQE